MPRGLYYERTARITNFWEMKDFRDVFHYDKLLLGKNIISGNISYVTGRVIIDDGVTRHNEVRSSLAFFTRVRVVEEVFVTSTFFKDFNPRANPVWVGNYDYTIGRYNWRPKTINYGYENYANNKYSDNGKERWEKFLQGYYFVSIASPIHVFKGRMDSLVGIGGAVFARYAIKYLTDKGQSLGGLKYGKPTLGFSLRFSILQNMKVFNHFYIEASPMFYVNKKQQQAWDPDYTYGFGYFDWRSFRLSLTYGNYAINRYPWNYQKYPEHNFWDGIFKISVNYMW